MRYDSSCSSSELIEFRVLSDAIVNKKIIEIVVKKRVERRIRSVLPERCVVRGGMRRKEPIEERKRRRAGLFYSIRLARSSLLQSYLLLI